MPAADQTTRILGAIAGNRARTDSARVGRTVYVAIAVEREPASPPATDAEQTQATGRETEPPRAGKGKDEPARDPASNVGGTDASPPPPPPVALNEFIHPRTGDHIYSTSETAPVGYEWHGTEGKIFTTATPRTRELRDEGVLIGFVFAFAEDETTPLYHCSLDGDDLFTTQREVAAQAFNDDWNCSGVAGYVVI